MTFPVSADIDDLTDEAVIKNTISIVRGLAKVANHLRDVDPDYVRELLRGMIDALDEADGMDSFGTEGWRDFIQ